MPLARSLALRRAIPRAFLIARPCLYLSPKSNLTANSSLSPAAPLIVMSPARDYLTHLVDIQNW